MREGDGKMISKRAEIGWGIVKSNGKGRRCTECRHKMSMYTNGDRCNNCQERLRSKLNFMGKI